MARYSDSGRVSRAGGPGQLLLLLIQIGFFYIVVFITLFPDWSHSAWQVEENLMGRVKRFNGVFFRCISPKQGAFKCDNYGKPTIVQKSTLQAQRALMVIASMLSFLGVAIGLLSLECTNLIENHARAKAKVGIVSSLCTFLSGTMVLICTIWYGVGVMNDFYNPAKANDSFRYEYGSCLYVGWITGALLFLIGIGNGFSAFKAYKSKGEEYSPVYNTYKASNKGIVASSIGNPVSDQKTAYV